jgi:drug/metabolite transporter (DMT)-like permease
MALGAFSFSIMSLSVRLVGQTIPTMEVVLARSIVVLLICWFSLRRRRISPWGKRRGFLFTRGFVGSISLAAFYYTLVHLPLADATILQHTSPIWTAFLAVPFLGERVGRREAFIALFSLGGVILMARPSFVFGGLESGLPHLPVLIGLFGAIFTAGAYVSVRMLGRTEDPIVVVFWFSMVSAGASLLFLPFGFAMPTWRELSLLLMVGAATYSGQRFLTIGLRQERAARASAIGYLQIVFAALWGLLLLGEIPDLWTVGGAAVVIGCSWLLGKTSDATPANPAQVVVAAE